MVVETRQKQHEETDEETRVWTYADLLAMPEDISRRYEILGGELFVAASPSLIHQLVHARLMNLLTNEAERRGFGQVLSGPVDIKRSEYEVAVPDILFIRRDRLDILDLSQPSLVEPPDLVVEILSPSTRSRDMTRKKAFYGAFGVKEYWLVDPLARTIEVLTLRDGVYEPLAQTKAGVHSIVMEGLAITPNQVFAVLREGDSSGTGATTPSTTGQTEPSAE